MKKKANNLKIKIKNNLLVKLARAKKENRYLKEKLAQEVIEKRDLYDVITKKDEKIRELSLKVQE